MRVCVFDTETVNLEKPFCYNIGYLIYDTELDEILVKHDYIVEQVWHNPMLFTTAYYANKKEKYISAMRGKTATLEKFGYIMQQMKRDFKAYEVENAFAYNSPFDEKVFDYNCDWFKCINPFDNIMIYDIRGYAHQYIVTDKYKAFCDKYSLYTETGNYSTTAEAMFRYISGNTTFDEEHTALADSEIELEILKFAVYHGATYGTNYATFRSIKREQNKTLSIKYNKEELLNINYDSITINKDKTEIKLTKH